MSKQAPVNTTAEVEKNPLRILATSLAEGSTGNAIIAMERAGQSSFVNSDTLPVDMSDETRQALEAAGVIFGDRVPGDDLFVYVTLPEGWTRRGTTHDMHSDLLDEKGRKRASVFYKAAFYDRRADVRIISRFDVRMDYSTPEGTLVVNVYDYDGVIFTASETYEAEKYSDEYYKVSNKLRGACTEWLNEKGFPDWTNAGLYWD